MSERVPWNYAGQVLGWPCNHRPEWNLLIPTSLGRFGRKRYPPRRPTPLIVHWGSHWVSRGYRLMWCRRWIPDSEYTPAWFESVTCEDCRAVRNSLGASQRPTFGFPQFTEE